MKPLNQDNLFNIRRPYQLNVVQNEKKKASSRFKILKEEITFWEDEAVVFQKMVLLNRKDFSHDEQIKLRKLEDELDYLIRKVFPGYKNLLTEVAQSAADQAELKRLEKRQEKLRHSYYRLKKRLLPFLPSKIKLIIW